MRRVRRWPPRADASRPRIDSGAEDRAVPLATVLVAVRNGAFTQEPRDEGLAHLYEHVLFRTYEGDPMAFWREMSDLGASANGTTSAEVVDYFIQVPSKRTKDALRVLARLVGNAKFTEADLSCITAIGDAPGPTCSA